MEESNEFNGIKFQKKGIIKFILIAVLILIVIAIAYDKIYQNTGKKEAQKYYQEIEEFLKKEYNEEFNIEFVKKGYKEKIESIDASHIKTGYYKNIIEYLYSFSPKYDDSIICYIAYYYEKDTGKSEIKEIKFNYELSTSTSEFICYRDYINDNKTLEIKETLENYLGQGYTIETHLDNIKNTMYIKTDKKIKDVMWGDIGGFSKMCNKVFELVKEKDCTNITLYYKDRVVVGFNTITNIWVNPGEYDTNNKSFDNINELISYLRKVVR